MLRPPPDAVNVLLISRQSTIYMSSICYAAPRCLPSILGAPPCASIPQLICYQCPFHTLSICYDTPPLAITMLWAPGNYDQCVNNVLSIESAVCLRYAVPPFPTYDMNMLLAPPCYQYAVYMLRCVIGTPVSDAICYAPRRTLSICYGDHRHLMCH